MRRIQLIDCPGIVPTGIAGAAITSEAEAEAFATITRDDESGEAGCGRRRSTPEVDLVLRGVVRAERLVDPTLFVPTILARAKKDHLVNVYGIREWEDGEDFLTKVCYVGAHRAAFFFGSP
jgi:hypothetical protein